MVSRMITGGILGKFEAAFAAMPLLVTFIPMLTDTGGNAGSQSSTLIIRGMAVGEIAFRLFRVLWKELQVNLLVGIVLSAVNFVRLAIFYPRTGGNCLDRGDCTLGDRDDGQNHRRRSSHAGEGIACRSCYYGSSADYDDCRRMLACNLLFCRTGIVGVIK